MNKKEKFFHGKLYTNDSDGYGVYSRNDAQKVATTYRQHGLYARITPAGDNTYEVWVRDKITGEQE